jgi:hypothetical protein
MKAEVLRYKDYVARIDVDVDGKTGMSSGYATACRLIAALSRSSR